MTDPKPIDWAAMLVTPLGPDDERRVRREAGTVRVAQLAVDPRYGPKDWVLAQRAFKVFVDSMAKTARDRGQPERGLTEDEARAWFDSWYCFLSIRRVLAMVDKARDSPDGTLPESDE